MHESVGTKRTSSNVRYLVANGRKADIARAAQFGREWPGAACCKASRWWRQMLSSTQCVDPRISFSSLNSNAICT